MQQQKEHYGTKTATKMPCELKTSTQFTWILSIATHNLNRLLFQNSSRAPPTVSQTLLQTSISTTRLNTLFYPEASTILILDINSDDIGRKEWWAWRWEHWYISLASQETKFLLHLSRALLAGIQSMRLRKDCKWKSGCNQLIWPHQSSFKNARTQFTQLSLTSVLSSLCKS